MIRLLVKTDVYMQLCKALCLIGISVSFAQVACAQQVNQLPYPNLPGNIQEPPNMAPAPGMRPPIGDGNYEPNIENNAAPAHVVSGKADGTGGSRFPTVPGDGYKAPILVKGSRRNETLMQYTEKYPYPNTKHITIGGKDYLYIDSDSPAEGDPKYANKWKFGGLPTIAKFGRTLILIGVVVATIFTAVAAYGMVMGEENAGSRVVFSVAGLMLLLMSFTIWKVVQANMANLNDSGPWDVKNGKLPPRILLPETLPEKTPPKAEDAPPRSGIPVYPDSGH